MTCRYKSRLVPTCANTIIMSNYIFLFISLYICNFCYAQQTIYTNHKEKQGISHHFSFVHLTDTHIGEGDEDGDYGTYGWLDEMPVGDVGYPAKRLRKAVNWINAHADSLKIKFVIVTGDITDSGERSEFLKFKEIISTLKIPYIPLIGNHDVWPYTRHTEAATPCGDSLMNVIFYEHFQQLERNFGNWNNGTLRQRVDNPIAGNKNFLQNFSFGYENYVFMLTDFGTRKHAEPGEKGVGPQADLHDFAGGTFPWVSSQLEKYTYASENVFLFTHWPMTKDPLVNVHLSSMAFSPSEYKKLAAMLYPYRAYVAAWFSGHIHRDRVQSITRINEAEEIALCIETAANKKFENGHFRIIRVWE